MANKSCVKPNTTEHSWTLLKIELVHWFASCSFQCIIQLSQDVWHQHHIHFTAAAHFQCGCPQNVARKCSRKAERPCTKNHLLNSAESPQKQGTKTILIRVFPSHPVSTTDLIVCVWSNINKRKKLLIYQLWHNLCQHSGPKGRRCGMTNLVLNLDLY